MLETYVQIIMGHVYDMFGDLYHSRIDVFLS